MLEMTAAPRRPNSRLSCQIVARRRARRPDGGHTRHAVLTLASRADGRDTSRRRPRRRTPTRTRLATARIARQALRHPRRRAAHGGDADDLRQPDRPQPRRRRRSSATSSFGRRRRRRDRAVHAAGASCSAATSSSTSSPPRASARTIDARSTASARCCSAWRWRCSPGAPTLGGLNAWKSGSGTMLIGFPEWIVYAAMVPPLVLTAVIALRQARARLRRRRRGVSMSAARAHRR